MTRVLVYPDPRDPLLLHHVQRTTLITDCGRLVFIETTYLTDDEVPNCLWCIARPGSFDKNG